MILKNLSWWLRVPHFLCKLQNLPSSESLFCLLNYSCFVIRCLNQLILITTTHQVWQLMSTVWAPSWMHPRQAGRLPSYLRPGYGGSLSLGCCQAGVKAVQIEFSSMMECSITMQRSYTQSQQTISTIMVCFQWNSDDEEKLHLKKDQKWQLYPVAKNHINVFVKKF